MRRAETHAEKRHACAKQRHTLSRDTHAPSSDTHASNAGREKEARDTRTLRGDIRMCVKGLETLERWERGAEKRHACAEQRHTLRRDTR